MNEINRYHATDEAAAPKGSAQVAEPPRDEAKRCRNCGQVVPQRFCSNCGQSVKEIRVSFYSLVMDFLGDYFTFDSKFFRSVKPLFFKPGFLTKAFMEGKRVSFIPPLRLYIFSSIIFFLTLSLATDPESITEELDSDTATTSETGTTGEPPSKIVAMGMPDGEGQEASTVDRNPNPEPTDDGSNPEKELPAAEPEQGAVSEPATRQKKSPNVQITSGRFSDNNRLGRYLNAKIDRQEKRLEGMSSEQILRGLLVKGIENIPKALFFLMPVFALFLKLLYVRRDPLYIDHLIFAFHYHAFLFVFYSMLIWANMATSIPLGSYIALASILVSPLYLFLSLKRVYSQGWFKTFLKFNVLVGLYFASLFFCLTTVVVVSIFLI